VGSNGAGRQLTPEVAAKRLCIGVADLPELGRPWTARDVAEMQRGRPEWLGCARATRAEEERLYGQRSAKTKRLRAAVSAETECGDAA